MSKAALKMVLLTSAVAVSLIGAYLILVANGMPQFLPR